MKYWYPKNPYLCGGEAGSQDGARKQKDPGLREEKEHIDLLFSVKLQQNPQGTRSCILAEVVCKLRLFLPDRAMIRNGKAGSSALLLVPSCSAR
jgi:hypothetical protein